MIKKISIVIGIVLVTVLIAVTIQVFTGSISHTREDKVKFDISFISGYLEKYKKDVGGYPTTTQGISVLVKDEKEYLFNRIPKDPWGNKYHYRYPGKLNKNSFDLWSTGADQQLGGEGENRDIGNWQQ